MKVEGRGIENCGEEFPAIEGDWIVRVGADAKDFILLRNRFYSIISSLVPHCALLHLHRFSDEAPAARAPWEAFHRGVNEKFAFREASRERIIQVGMRGFDLSSEMLDDVGYFVIGLFFTPNQYRSTAWCLRWLMEMD